MFLSWILNILELLPVASFTVDSVRGLALLSEKSLGKWLRFIKKVTEIAPSYRSMKQWNGLKLSIDLNTKMPRVGGAVTLNDNEFNRYLSGRFSIIAQLTPNLFTSRKVKRKTL